MIERMPRGRPGRRAASVLVAAAIVAGASACTAPPPAESSVELVTPAPPETGTADPPGGAAAESGEVTSEQPTREDVAFVEAMAAHHEQAVELASLAPGRVGDSELEALAARIAVTQAAEAAAMREWLDRRRSRELGRGDGAGGHAHSEAMAGEIGRPTLDRAAELEGAAFDALFLDAMIAHHRGAVTMAEARLAAAGEPAVARWARSIAETQSLEIARLAAIEERLGAG